MIAGARQGTLSGLRRLVAFAITRDLGVYIIPGPEIAHINGLDIEATGMRIVASPRHATVLLVIGDIPPALREAATVIYAQMMRPRVLIALNKSPESTELSPLPAADVVAGISQQELIRGVDQLRTALQAGAFQPAVTDFDASVLQIKIEYTCSMHPEIIRDEPGSCPKCGMDLIQRETQASAAHNPQSIDHAVMDHKSDQTSEHASLQPMDHSTSVDYTCPMHPEVIQNEPGSCPKCGMNLELRKAKPSHDHHHMQHDAPVEYTCPMHPEVIQNEPGSCPKCGMNLEPRKTEAAHEHNHMQHDAPVEYTCPMHPEVIQNEPGSCPKCGMNLEPRKTEAAHEHNHMQHDAPVEYTCPMHPEVIQNEPGSCPKCGMNLELREAKPSHDHHHMQHDAPVEYICLMHPEVIQNEPGSCPKCGMFLEPRGETKSTKHDHAGVEPGIDHSNMDHDDMGFMSMIDVTKDLPRSIDGLAMDWIDVAFGPFFPGLPGGLLLSLTLDGDTVAGSSVNSLVGNQPLLLSPTMGIDNFIERLATFEPLAPNCYRLLACLAIENAAAIEVESRIAKARVVAVEQERIVSHLGWLAMFGRQTSFDWLLQRAESLQRQILQADLKQIVALQPAVSAMHKRLLRTPLLKSRTRGIGRIIVSSDNTLSGPIARASGIKNDTRNSNPIYHELGFVQANGTGGDVQARLQLRIDEINHSLALIEQADVTTDIAISACHVSTINNLDGLSGTGEAVIETARGQAHLQVTLDKGKVIDAQLQTPSSLHLGLIEQLTEQQELGDALVTVGSLDLSPWEIRV
ncbi:Lead, cadmium, zinc and mercury transporting ATPase; Copper-translocating P-type ATPase [hydrothermal vent metagenome]|uniref:Lead, cadmium, zinc and mercury transporting ATPase Copper-translocating P-type ATPase n=1 Tax=hydrothermal vent metagenome TaxID=652676 RepID=A0A3B0ZG60_9ZZZZ